MELQVRNFRVHRLLLIFLTFGLAALLASALSLALDLSRELPDWHQIEQRLSRKGLVADTLVIDRDGAEVVDITGGSRRYIQIDHFPRTLIAAVLSAEDREFYHHPGISISGIGRAALSNFRGSGWSQGASTITQQLVRNQFLSREKTIHRKIREIVLALAVERRFTKEQILEYYMNSVYLGAGTYGFESASRRYFGKSVSGLTLGESALLAALPQAPSRFASNANFALVLARQQSILELMERNGDITPENLALATAEAPKLARHRFDFGQWGYVANAVKGVLGRRYELDGPDRNGLRIYTSLEKNAQQRLFAKLQYLKEQHSKGSKAARSQQIAGVTIDSATGGILALIGGADFRLSEFDRARAMRRPVGRLIDAFAYALAVENGYALSASKMGSGGNRTIIFRHPGGAELVAESAQIIEKIGLRPAEMLLRKLGFPGTRQIWGQASVEVRASPLEIATAFAALLNGGSLSESHLITEIRDATGAVIYRRPDQTGVKVLTSEAALGALTMLRSQNYGNAGFLGVTMTDNGRNEWLVAAEGAHVTVIWRGSEKGESAPMRSLADAQRSFDAAVGFADKFGLTTARR
jgi:penicillin-binding protein 1A